MLRYIGGYFVSDVSNES